MKCSIWRIIFLTIHGNLIALVSLGIIFLLRWVSHSWIIGLVVGGIIFAVFIAIEYILQNYDGMM